MQILVLDIGGSTVKLQTNAGPEIRQFQSGPEMTPSRLIEQVNSITQDWHFDVVSIGYPGEVRGGLPSREPNNLGPGWVGFDFRGALRRPIRIVNDAAMQAIGSYRHGRMLFLGLGTGLGSSLVVYGAVQPLELTSLPYRDGLRFGDVLGQRGIDRFGLDAWRQEVATIVPMLRDALVVDNVVLGGGNVRHLTVLPPHTTPGNNALAFEGGFRLWRDPEIRA